MLYATTRSKVETYTAQRALKEDRAPDGGLYIPAQLPSFSKEELAALWEQPCGGVLAEILNRFFNTKLSQWDVEFAVGKELFGLTQMSHRIVFGEVWRNPQGGFGELVQGLTELVSAEAGTVRPGTWMGIAVRVGLLFAIYGELRRRRILSPGDKLDAAVPTADLTAVFAACYARKMGLPMGTIVCCCNDNGGMWDLVCRGQMKLNAKVVPTNTPDWDFAVPQGLELMIYTLLGPEECEQFLKIWEKGSTYFLGVEQHRHFRQGLDACVVSQQRLSGVIPNLYRTNGYVLCPYSALVYSGLMDYRSITRQRSLALVFSETNPQDSLEVIAPRLGVSPQQLRDRINNS